MADGVRTFLVKDRGDGVAIDDVDDMERHVRWKVVLRTARQIVDDRHRVSRCQEAVYDVAPDESGAAGNENFHGVAAAPLSPPERRTRSVDCVGHRVKAASRRQFFPPVATSLKFHNSRKLATLTPLGSARVGR